MFDLIVSQKILIVIVASFTFITCAGIFLIYHFNRDIIKKVDLESRSYLKR